MRPKEMRAWVFCFIYFCLRFRCVCGLVFDVFCVCGWVLLVGWLVACGDVLLCCWCGGSLNEAGLSEPVVRLSLHIYVHTRLTEDVCMCGCRYLPPSLSIHIHIHIHATAPT
jgi:hypothetical protein